MFQAYRVLYVLNRLHPLHALRVITDLKDRMGLTLQLSNFGGDSPADVKHMDVDGFVDGAVFADKDFTADGFDAFAANNKGSSRRGVIRECGGGLIRALRHGGYFLP